MATWLRGYHLRRAPEAVCTPQRGTAHSSLRHTLDAWALPMIADASDVLPAEASAVLDWWYGDLAARLKPDYQHRYQLWFSRAADDEIKRRFGGAIAAVGGSDEKRRAWCRSPRGAIAYIVLLDQLNRNVHRGTAQMFAHDAKCTEEARRLVDERRHLDGSLAAPELAHVSICLSHSESLDDHTLNGQLIRELVVPSPQRRDFDGHAHMAGVHAEEIRRFGRYPHRNALLGRQDTAEEAEWLVQSAGVGYHKQVQK